MKIQVKTSIEPSYRIPILSKILNRFGHKMPVIEGYQAFFNVDYSDLDLEDTTPLLSVKPVIVEPHGVEDGIDRWVYLPWQKVNNLTMKFYPSVSGYIELRVYFKDLKNSDEIIDDFRRSQPFKGDIDSHENIRYYYKPFKIYSLYEVLMISFTSIVTIFTILLFIITLCFFC